MDTKELRDLIRTEDETLELKEDIGGSLDEDLVAFANTDGGEIIVGVDDQGSVTGLENMNEKKSQIQDIAHQCHPRIPIDITAAEDASVLVVDVKETGEFHRCSGGYYAREGATSRKLDHSEIKKRILALGKTSWDSRLCRDFSYPRDFDTDRFNEYLEMCEIQPSGINIEETLTSLGIAVRDDDELQLTNCAVLFFADDPQRFFSNAEVICARFSSENRADLGARKKITGNLVEMIQQTASWLEAKLESRISIVGLKREENLEIPMVVLREAVTNAIMHRDYSRDQESVHIDLFPSSLHIRNPGGLVEDMREEDLGKKSSRRNDRIAQLLDKANFVDRVGTGIPRMKKELGKAGLDEPTFNTNSHFEVVITRDTYQHSLRDMSEADMNQRQKEGLRHAHRSGRITTRWYANQFSIKADKARSEIKDLIDKGFLEKRGKKKGTRYVPAQNS